ncbi:MAG: acylneuraminate cytidylyltransferase family protein [Thermincola sp.]|jgi:N-acylneuraminate cytidylyltransferase|nr:acylneuraminate cytidylyltransferase family protein [Thermincola sp.]MDT3704050.1 acylneuraminate cytidylyltransferase family protein [Thermincola sp.]
MINNKKVLGIIPARGGSKGIPRKNIKLLAGKPLIAWTIEEAKKSQYLDRFILSSEDAEIITTAKSWGCEAPFVRPAELARDDTPGIDPVMHALFQIGEHFDYVVLLQPTSPLRTVEDIDGCICFCVQEGAPACVSVSLTDKHPYWMHILDKRHRLHPLFPTAQSIQRRQDLPPVYIENGAVYVAQKDFLLNTKSFTGGDTLAYVMLPERSWDIDNESDFFYCSLQKGGYHDITS